MIIYLARQYYINSLFFVLGLTILPILHGWDWLPAIQKAIFWGGLFGGTYTYYFFRERKIWPLFDNLRLPKYLLLLEFFILLQFLNLIVGALIE